MRLLPNHRRPCRFPECDRPSVFHVLFDGPGEREYSNLCRRHCADALRDGARSAHPIEVECVDTMYYPQLSTWLDRENRCGIPTTPVDPFEGWRLQDA